MEFTPFITTEDIKSKGYDLHRKGALNLGSYNTPEEAANGFIQDCFDSIYDLIEQHRGAFWTIAFFEDMSEDIDPEIYPKAWIMQDALKSILINQTIFIYENGDKEASAKVDIERLGYSPKAIRKLYNAGILED